ncbi:MAG: Cof-type HAD-IIB family hydrolase [Corynebacterium sp.]|nr:Cof-type HAD-IIB family hydrolase [Corynebacterium sp.]
MKQPELIVSDLDGTLLQDNERVSPRLRAVLSRAHRAGVPIILATGRPQRWVHPVIEQLDFDPMCVTGNGAVVYDSSQQKITDSFLLETEVMGCVVKQAMENIGPHIGFGVERLVEDVFAPEHEHFAINESFNRLWPDNGEGVEEIAQLIERPAVKLLIRDSTRTASEMYALMGDVPGAQITYSIDVGLLEVSAEGVTKAHTLDILAARMGIDPANVIAFGDMPNDAAMLEWAGCGVAMGNAHADLKKIANRVTASNDEDGVAVVLEEFYGK